MIRITVDDLLTACNTGVEAFKTAFPRGLSVPAWTPWCQAVVLGTPSLRPFWGWAVAKGVVPAWSMAGWCLAGANLTRANLTGANLTWANLTRANLAGTKLTGANLDGANLDGANLTRANLIDANLTGACRPCTDPPIPGWVGVNGRLCREVQP